MRLANGKNTSSVFKRSRPTKSGRTKIVKNNGKEDQQKDVRRCGLNLKNGQR